MIFFFLCISILYLKSYIDLYLYLGFIRRLEWRLGKRKGRQGANQIPGKD